jgi:hypothetical protein
MSTRLRYFVAFLCLPLTHAALHGGDEPHPSSKNKTAEIFFGLTEVHRFHLELSADAWQKMQPPAPRFGPGFGPPGFGPKKPAPPNVAKPQSDESADVHKSAGAFGTEFPWVKGEFTANGQQFGNIGVRFKGNFAYMQGQLQLNRYARKHFKHELFVPAATAPFHDDAIAAGMLLQE